MANATPALHQSLARVLWWDQLPAELTEPIGRPLDQDASAHVAIVGAGFTGLWTASYLKQREPDLDIVVIEKDPSSSSTKIHRCHRRKSFFFLYFY